MNNQVQHKGTEKDIELIIGNSNSNFSGVTSTMLQLLSTQQKLINLRVMGKHHLPDESLNITFWQVVKLCKQPLLKAVLEFFMHVGLMK